MSILTTQVPDSSEYQLCPLCEGDGSTPTSPSEICRRCGGVGEVFPPNLDTSD